MKLKTKLFMSLSVIAVIISLNTKVVKAASYWPQVKKVSTYITDAGDGKYGTPEGGSTAVGGTWQNQGSGMGYYFCTERYVDIGASFGVFGDDNEIEIDYGYRNYSGAAYSSVNSSNWSRINNSGFSHSSVESGRASIWYSEQYTTADYESIWLDNYEIKGTRTRYFKVVGSGTNGEGAGIDDLVITVRQNPIPKNGTFSIEESPYSNAAGHWVKAGTSFVVTANAHVEPRVASYAVNSIYYVLTNGYTNTEYGRVETGNGVMRYYQGGDPSIKLIQSGFGVDGNVNANSRLRMSLDKDNTRIKYSFTSSKSKGGYKEGSPYKSMFTVTSDGVAPVLNLSPNTTAWTNKDVTISATASDSGSGVKNITRPNGVNVASTSTSHVVSTNGNYTFKSTDNVGNLQTNTINVANIDKVNPTIGLTASTASMTTGNVIITATASDNLSGVKQVKLPNGTLGNKGTNSYTVTKNGSYTFEVTDNAGNVATSTINVSNIDNDNPTLDLSQNPTDWTNKDVTIKAVGSDASTSVNRIGKPDGTVANSSTTTYTVGANAVYKFYALDIVGHRVDSSINITNIDKVKPTIKLSQSITASTNKPVVISYISDDDLSGVQRIKLPNGSYSSNAVGSLTVSSSGTYVFEVEDKAGNTEVATINISNIDDELPTLDLMQNPTDWTNKDVRITAMAKDSLSGIAVIGLPDGTEVKKETTGYTVGSNGVYSFYAVDNVTNRVDKSISITNIDKVNPKVSLSASPSSWTSGEVTITAKATDDLSGVKQVKSPDGVISNNSTVLYKTKENGIYTFEVMDKAGNVGTETISISNIDKEVPTLKLSQNPTYWTNKDVTITALGTDTSSGVNRIGRPDGTVVNAAVAEYVVTKNGLYDFYALDKADNRVNESINITNIDKVKPRISLSASTTSWTYKDITITAKVTDDLSGVKQTKLPDGTINISTTPKYVAKTNGSYTFEVEDNAGNKETETIIIGNIDRDDPTLELSQNPKTWTNKDVTITALGKDSTSAVNRIGKPDGTVVNSNNATYMASANGVYWFYAMDMADNRVDKSIDITNIDKVKPTIKLTPSTKEPTNKPIVISYEASDDLSGVKRVKTPGGIYVEGESSNITVKKNGSYTFEVEDNAGNIGSSTINITNYDDTAPIVNIVANPTDWTNKDVTLTVTATDNVAVRRIRQVGDATWINGDNMKLVVGLNDTYKFEAQDTAGNIGENFIVVSNIDKIAPSGTFTPNSMSWTNNLDPITVGFKPSDEGGSQVKHWRYRTTCTKLDKAGTKEVSEWSGYTSGITTGSITLTTEGQWSIEVEVTDNAGNISIVKSGDYQLGYELKLIDYRVVSIVKPPAEYIYPISIDNMPVEVKSGYNVKFNITVIGAADSLQVQFYDNKGLNSRVVDMKWSYDITGQTSVWECEFATSINTPLETIIYSNIIGKRGNTVCNFNAVQSWGGETLKIVGSALDDTGIQRVY